jgi:hypothetical protein
MADQSVWIVVFKGGNAPAGAPGGAQVTFAPITLTGVIVDDQTGDVLGMFMH